MVTDKGLRLGTGKITKKNPSGNLKTPGTDTGVGAINGVVGNSAPDLISFFGKSNNSGQRKGQGLIGNTGLRGGMRHGTFQKSTVG